MKKYTQKLYNIKIKFMVGDIKLNTFISAFDLGIEGVFVPDSISFTTKTKPSKIMEQKYITAIKQSAKENGKEIIDIQIIYSL